MDTLTCRHSIQGVRAVPKCLWAHGGGGGGGLFPGIEYGSLLLEISLFLWIAIYVLLNS